MATARWASGVIQLRGAPEHGQLIVDPDGPQRCRLHHTPDAPDAYGLSRAAACTPLPAPSRSAGRCLDVSSAASF
ncbi:hypothetical protein QT383_19720 [Stenotrophomonas rhizophila]